MIDIIKILRDPAGDAAAGAAAGAAKDSGAPAAGAGAAAPVVDAGAAPAGGDKDKGAAGSDAGKAKSLLDQAKAPAAAETPEQKTAREATETENKRLLAADDKALSAEDLAKKQALVKAADDAKKAEGDKNKGQAPEKYEFKAPEGMTLDQALVDKVSPIFKELGLTQEQANKLFNAYAENVKVSTAAIAKAQDDSFNKFVEGLKDETIKSLGADYEKELSFAARARDRFASTELIEKLNQSGFANDKDMIGLFIKIGKLISEDKTINGAAGQPGAEGKVTASQMFPSMEGADKR